MSQKSYAKYSSGVVHYTSSGQHTHRSTATASGGSCVASLVLIGAILLIGSIMFFLVLPALINGAM